MGAMTPTPSAGAPSPFPSIANWRDLGYWIGFDEKIVRPGVVYRTNDFAEISDADRAGLAALELKTIVDLRTQSERSASPDPKFTGTREVVLDVLADNNTPAMAASLDKVLADPKTVHAISEALTVDKAKELDARLRELGGEHRGLIVRHGVAEHEIPQLAQRLGALAVFASHDDEPAAQRRDAHVRGHLADHGIAFHTCKDHVVFERQEVMTLSGTAFSVFTPYKNAWLRKVNDFYLKAYPVERHAQHLAPRPEALRQPVPSLQDLGFEPTNLQDLHIPCGESGAQSLLADFLQRIDAYGQRRDFPAVKGPSYLSVHLRFGTVSIRQLAREAHARMIAGSEGAAVWLSELIWRDFYVQVLANFAHVGAGESFKRDYDAIHWDHGPHGHKLFDAWCAGRTGYPLVDAAMRQLRQEGFMHNRARMTVGSFLCKDLYVDWRAGACASGKVAASPGFD